MADLAGWLRLGPRARTPTVPSPTHSERAARDSQPVAAAATTTTDPPRRPGPSRAASYLSLSAAAAAAAASGASPTYSEPAPTPEPLSASSDDSLLRRVREDDRVWYNPSLEQMVEALQAGLLGGAGGVLAPLPVEYNAHVLHLIEGYAAARARVRAAEAAGREAREALELNFEHFRAVADEWVEREGQYKAEIKRLEGQFSSVTFPILCRDGGDQHVILVPEHVSVTATLRCYTNRLLGATFLLSRTSQEGLEAVTLARTNSIVDRNGPQAKQFLSRLRRLGKDQGDEKASSASSTSFVPPRSKWQWSLDPEESAYQPELARTRKGSDPESPKIKVPLPKILDSQNDFLMSEKIRRSDMAAHASANELRDRRHRLTKANYREQASEFRARAADTSTSGAVDTKAAPPLFSQHVPASSDGTRTEKVGPGEQYARQQMLESLLNCDTNDGGDGPAKFPKPSEPQAMGEEVGTPDELGPSSKRDRPVSTFSFEPGDDTFASLEDGQNGHGHGHGHGHESEGSQPLSHEQAAAQVWRSARHQVAGSEGDDEPLARKTEVRQGKKGTRASQQHTRWPGKRAADMKDVYSTSTYFVNLSGYSWTQTQTQTQTRARTIRGTPPRDHELPPVLIPTPTSTRRAPPRSYETSEDVEGK
ncbi:hypothetical protein F4780DRAFT_797507 [Xylariomycetidae sp. FL0641]|nr:hypothetical protein F4780DRAFT_797507 [Xylariomycetidae sp. FL0641]